MGGAWGDQGGRFIPWPGPWPGPGLGIAAWAAHARLPLSCEGRVEGRPGCGAGRWVGGGGGGELVRRAGARHPVSSPSWWPAAAVGVAVPPWRRARSARRRSAAAGAGAGGAILVQQAGSPSCGGGRGPSHHWPCVAVPGGGPWWPARGSVPWWRAWAGIGLAVGPSPMRVAEVPAVRALLPSRRAMRGGRHRACPARPVAKCVWARCRGRSPPLTPRCAGSPGVPPRRRGGRRRGHDPRPL